ncbi:MAG: M16 family metallopeptidase [Phycisphaerales bacterium JB043]
MTTVLEPRGAVRSCSLCWLLPTGASHDPDDRLGRSAMWEELLHRGAGDLDSRAHADALDGLGASVSSGVDTRFIRIRATCLGERLLDLLPLVVDMVREPRFDPESIEPARALCVSSIRALEDEPSERCILRARESHAPVPFNRSGLGTVDGVGACTHEELVLSWAECAVADGSILALAGAFDADSVVSRLDALLEGWGGACDEPHPRGEPTRGYHHIDDDTNQVQIVLMHDAPSEPDSDSILERVVSSVLSGGMSGRLFTEVRERRSLCYSVSSSYATDRDFGRVTGYVGTTPERAQESLDVMLEQLDRINTPEGRVTPDEFDRAIIGMKSRVVMSGESMASRSGALARDVFCRGEARTLAQISAQIDAVTLDQVNDYLARRQTGELTICTLGPAPLRAPDRVMA